ncbi:MAG: FAD-dependent oxidoreductase [Gammaproteobacteria bacterium]|nr:FAD-dependent oxidoreductase [Gammaproteobacteria bacterium]
MKHVIIGAGPAGVSAAEHLRKLDSTAEIVIIGDEAEPPYSRMAIPYYLVGDIEEAGTWQRKNGKHFKNLGVKLIHDTVVSVSPSSVRLKTGKRINFDRLLIATGSRPVQPPVRGLNHPAVHHCWTLADAREIAKRMQKGSEVVLMGAGFIGCIILQALVERGVDLTVVEMEEHMVPRMMNAEAGAMIKRWCQARGVRIITSAHVIEVAQQTESEKTDVIISTGEALSADLIIVATGVRANLGFLEGSAIAVDQGVVVDRQLQTSIYGIFAAGDVAQGPDFSTNGTAVHAIQTTASQHGRIAALNMAGRKVLYHGSLAMNTLETLGLISTSYGNWQGVPDGDSAVAINADAYRYLSLQFDGDVIIGAIAIGLTDHIGALRGLIESRIKLGLWKDRLVEDPYRLMEAYLARTGPG